MSLALGIQNGAFQRTGGISVHTTYLTELITPDDYGSEKNRKSWHADPKLNLLYGIWLAFFVGGR